MSDLQPRDSFVTDPREVRRLTGQNQRILQALQQGPQTARALSAISLKYTSRISEIRRAGHDIRCEERGGISIYRLITAPPQAQGHDLNAPQDGRLL
jgi:hypothetical protein